MEKRNIGWKDLHRKSLATFFASLAQREGWGAKGYGHSYYGFIKAKRVNSDSLGIEILSFFRIGVILANSNTHLPVSNSHSFTKFPIQITTRIVPIPSIPFLNFPHSSFNHQFHFISLPRCLVRPESRPRFCVYVSRQVIN